MGIYNTESLPNITGKMGVNDGGIVSGAFYGTGGDGWNFSNRGGICTIFNASRSSSAYQNNAKVQPDNAEIMFCIRY